MATLELSAGDNVHADTNAKITSALSAAATVYMDDIGSDSGEVDAGTIVPLINTGTADVTVKDKYGHAVGYVKAKTSAWLVAGNDEVWRVLPAAAAFEKASKISDPAGGSTTDAEARTAIASIIDALENAGISAAS